MTQHPHTSGDHSFLVHMQSLTGFTRELETQLDGLVKPTDDLAAIAGKPLLLGDFGEAHGLVQSHDETITEMCDLLGQVKQAIAFADEVTQVVAGHYLDADRDVAAALGLGS
jgi:hypothetical protein